MKRLIYKKGGFIAGVPARDLTPEETKVILEKYSLDDLSKHYSLVDDKKTAKGEVDNG